MVYFISAALLIVLSVMIAENNFYFKITEGASTIFRVLLGCGVLVLLTAMLNLVTINHRLSKTKRIYLNLANVLLFVSALYFLLGHSSRLAGGTVAAEFRTQCADPNSEVAQFDSFMT